MVRWYSVLLVLLFVIVQKAESFANGDKTVHTRKGSDSTKVYQSLPVHILNSRFPAIEPLPPTQGAKLWSGKKTEVLHLSAIDANKALNTTRQLFARVPGIFVWENDMSGIQANIAVRGLSPNRSWELNMRMDGADIASDAFGYPEAYYTPPFESIERIELVRGSAGLQFGPQFGGLLNYITKSASRFQPFSLESSHIVGNNGLYSTFTGFGGTVGDWSYYAYGQYKRGDGWRPSQSFWQYSGHLKVEYTLAERSRLKLSLTRMDYKLRQVGGLTDAQFSENAQQSLRQRDWFGTPWFIPTVEFDHQFSDNTHLTVQGFGLVGERNSVGIIASPQSVDNGTTTPRRVDRDFYRNIGVETRLLTRTDIGLPLTLAGGFRVSRGSTQRERARGRNDAELTLDYTAAPTLAMNFVTENFALFSEAQIEASEGLLIVPGIRMEFLSARANGSWTNAAADFSSSGTPKLVEQSAHESLPLFGLGISYKLVSNLEARANISQAYRAATFSDQFQNSSVDVDPNLHSSRGFSSDVGIRGTLYNRFTFDIGMFYIHYADKVGTLSRAAALVGRDSLAFPERLRNGLRTNIGVSRHYGLESLLNFEILQSSTLSPRSDNLSVFLAISYTSALYLKGAAEGKRVEFAPEWIIRSGLTYSIEQVFSLTLTGSHVGESYSDANNTVFQANAVQGLIPEYTVWDVSAFFQPFVFLRFEASLNNIFDRRYFTRRAGGFPGPGILPADGRTVSAGLRWYW